jgi:hypothetical protein
MKRMELKHGMLLQHMHHMKHSTPDGCTLACLILQSYAHNCFAHYCVACKRVLLVLLLLSHNRQAT